MAVKAVALATRTRFYDVLKKGSRKKLANRTSPETAVVGASGKWRILRSNQGRTEVVSALCNFRIKTWLVSRYAGHFRTASSCPHLVRVTFALLQTLIPWKMQNELQGQSYICNSRKAPRRKSKKPCPDLDRALPSFPCALEFDMRRRNL